MKKIFVITILVLLVSSCWKQANNSDNKITIKTEKQIHTVLKPVTFEQKAWAMYKYFKKDLTKDEQQKVLNLLDERKKEIIKIKSILLQANKTWTFDEKMQEVIVMRKDFENKFLPYIADDKKDIFKKAYDAWNQIIRKKFEIK